MHKLDDQDRDLHPGGEISQVRSRQFHFIRSACVVTYCRLRSLGSSRAAAGGGILRPTVLLSRVPPCRPPKPLPPRPSTAMRQARRLRRARARSGATSSSPSSPSRPSRRCSPCRLGPRGTPPGNGRKESSPAKAKRASAPSALSQTAAMTPAVAAFPLDAGNTRRARHRIARNTENGTTPDSPDFFRYLSPSPHAECRGVAVTAGGSYRAAPDCPYPPRGHPANHQFTWGQGRVLGAYQMLNMTEGEGRFESRGAGPMALTAGQVLLLFPHSWCRYEPTPASGWREYWIEMRGPVLPCLHEEGVIDPASPVRTCHDGSIVGPLFERILSSPRDESPRDTPLAGAWALELLAQLFGSTPGDSAPWPIAQAVARAERLLEAHLAKHRRCSRISRASLAWGTRIFAASSNAPPAFPPADASGGCAWNAPAACSVPRRCRSKRSPNSSASARNSISPPRSRSSSMSPPRAGATPPAPPRANQGRQPAAFSCRDRDTALRPPPNPQRWRPVVFPTRARAERTFVSRSRQRFASSPQSTALELRGVSPART